MSVGEFVIKILLDEDRKYLSKSDVVTLRAVSKNMYIVANSSYLWKKYKLKIPVDDKKITQTCLAAYYLKNVQRMILMKPNNSKQTNPEKITNLVNAFSKASLQELEIRDLDFVYYQKIIRLCGRQLRHISASSTCCDLSVLKPLLLSCCDTLEKLCFNGYNVFQSLSLSSINEIFLPLLRKLKIKDINGCQIPDGFLRADLGFEKLFFHLPMLENLTLKVIDISTSLGVGFWNMLPKLSTLKYLELQYGDYWEIPQIHWSIFPAFLERLVLIGDVTQTILFRIFKTCSRLTTLYIKRLVVRDVHASDRDSNAEKLEELEPMYHLKNLSVHQGPYLPSLFQICQNVQNLVTGFDILRNDYSLLTNLRNVEIVVEFGRKLDISSFETLNRLEKLHIRADEIIIELPKRLVLRKLILDFKSTTITIKKCATTTQLSESFGAIIAEVYILKLSRISFWYDMKTIFKALNPYISCGCFIISEMSSSNFDISTVPDSFSDKKPREVVFDNCCNITKNKLDKARRHYPNIAFRESTFRKEKRQKKEIC